jgi:hypothetical protein
LSVAEIKPIICGISAYPRQTIRNIVRRQKDPEAYRFDLSVVFYIPEIGLRKDKDVDTRKFSVFSPNMPEYFRISAPYYARYYRSAREENTALSSDL